MKLWQKIALTVFLSLAVFSVFIVMGILSLLPDPARIGRMIQSSPARTGAVSSTTDHAPVKTSKDRPLQSALPTPTLTGEPKTKPDVALRKKQVTEKFIDRYLSSDRIQSRVCDSLAASGAPFRDIDEFAEQLEKTLLGETPPSATAEAVMLPIEFTLKNEAVRELVDAARNAADRGDTGFVHKAQFYAQAARATASVLSSQDELEKISAGAYQLYTLSRAAALKPSILQDPEMGDFCRGIERAAVDGLNRDAAFDRERMARLLSKHGITNESIEYDPEMSTRLSLVTNESGVHLKMPWLDAVFKNSSKASR